MSEQKKFPHLMIDLETLGTSLDAVILSIGAVPFNMVGEMGEAFEIFPTVQDQIPSRKVQWSAIEWWFKQEEQARLSIIEQVRSRMLHECLMLFKDWCEYNLDEKFRVWSNGASFDIAMMNLAFANVNLETPWSYKNQMDCPTMVYMSKISTKKYDGVGVKHNAVNDCKWQISWTVDAFRILRGTY